MLFSMETRTKRKEGIRMIGNEHWWLLAQERGEPLIPYRIVKASCSNCGATWEYKSPIPEVAIGTIIDIHRCR